MGPVEVDEDPPSPLLQLLLQLVESDKFELAAETSLRVVKFSVRLRREDATLQLVDQVEQIYRETATAYVAFPVYFQ